MSDAPVTIERLDKLEKRLADGLWHATTDADQRDVLKALRDYRRLREGVVLDRKVAETIRAVFLPANPRKMKQPHPDVLHAVNEMIKAVQP